MSSPGTPCTKYFRQHADLAAQGRRAGSRVPERHANAESKARLQGEYCKKKQASPPDRLLSECEKSSGHYRHFEIFGRRRTEMPQVGVTRYTRFHIASRHCTAQAAKCSKASECVSTFCTEPG